MFFGVLPNLYILILPSSFILPSVSAPTRYSLPKLLRESIVAFQRPRARRARQIPPHHLTPHSKQMLSDGRYIRIIRRRIERISILQRKPIAVVDVDITVRHVVHEQAPEQISRHHGVGHVLPGLDRREELRQRRAGGRVAVVVVVPRVLAHDVRLACRAREGDVGVELRQVARVVVVRDDVDCLDWEVVLVDAVGAVDDEFLGRELFNVCGYLGGPGDGHVHVTEDGTAELVACLVGKDCGILCVSEVRVGIAVREEGMNVVLEVGDYGGVCVELLDEG